MASRELLLKNCALAAFVACVAYSGFAWPLAYGRGLFPWNRGWFMFSSESGYDYHLLAEGERADGTSGPLDLSGLFRVSVGDGDRFQETPRYQEHMDQAAAYLCEKLALRTVSLTDISWRREPGRRLAFSEVPGEKRTEKKWVESRKCASSGS